MHSSLVTFTQVVLASYSFPKIPTLSRCRARYLPALSADNPFSSLQSLVTHTGTPSSPNSSTYTHLDLGDNPTLSALKHMNDTGYMSFTSNSAAEESNKLPDVAAVTVRLPKGQSRDNAIPTFQKPLRPLKSKRDQQNFATTLYYDC